MAIFSLQWKKAKVAHKKTFLNKSKNSWGNDIGYWHSWKGLSRSAATNARVSIEDAFT